MTIPAPAILRDLFGLADGIDARPFANAVVAAQAVRDAVRAAVARVLPDARIAAPFLLPRGRADVAIVAPQIAIGILIDATDPIGAAPKSGCGSDAFDYAVAIAAFPKDHHLEHKPPHVWGLRAYVARDGSVAFTLERPGSEPAPDRGAYELLHLLPVRDLKRLAIARGVKTNRDRELRAALAATLDAAQARRAVAETIRGAARAWHESADGDSVADALALHLFRRDAPNAVVREFACPGSIADVALLEPGALHLFEIKGETDAATRLSRQVLGYESVASTCTLVVTCNHRSFRDKVPPHWGLIEAERRRDGFAFMRLRAAMPNPNRSLVALTELFDTAEMRRILRQAGHLPAGSHGAVALRRLLCEAVEETVLAQLVFRALALRTAAMHRARVRARFAAANMENWPGLAALLPRAPRGPQLL